MQNGKSKNVNTPYSRPPAPYVDLSKRRSPKSSRLKGPHDAQRNYERYLALAQVEVQSGNSLAAENCYQQGDHYFRSMTSARETT